MPGPFGRQQYVMLPEEELRAQQEAMAQAPQAQPQPSYTNDFLGFLQGLTKQQEAAQSQHAAQMAQEMSGAKEQDAAQRFANMMMAGGATMLGNPNVSSQYMQLAQQNNAQNALQLKDKNFQEWLGKRFDIGKQAGEYNQARYHDLMSQQNQANRDLALSKEARNAIEFDKTAAQRAKQAEDDAAYRKQQTALGWANIAADRERVAASAEERKLQREMMYGQKTAKDVQSQVEDLSKRFQKGASADSVKAIQDALAGGSDLPGFGRIASMAPNAVVGPEGNKLRAAVTDLIDLRLRARTGANAPEAEVERMKQTYNLFTGASDDQVKTGLKKLLEDTRQELTQTEAGYSPEAREEFKRRGGIGPADIFKERVGNVRVRQKSTGKTKIVSQDLAAQLPPDDFEVVQ